MSSAGDGSFNLLGDNLQVARGVQVAVTPCQKQVIASAPIEDMIWICIEMLSRGLVLTRTIKTEVHKSFFVVTEKLKEKLVDSTNSLKENTSLEE